MDSQLLLLVLHTTITYVYCILHFYTIHLYAVLIMLEIICFKINTFFKSLSLFLGSGGMIIQKTCDHVDNKLDGDSIKG